MEKYTLLMVDGPATLTKVATKAPSSGDFAANQLDTWTTIVNLLRNAFVQGLREGFEGQTPQR